MANLQNLIPDPTTLGLWECRPACTLLVDLNAPGTGPFSTGFSSGFQTGFFSGGTAGPISIVKVVGDRVYGMVGGPSGFDYPFVFNLITGQLQFVTGGMVTANLPTTQPQTGAWIPPTMAVVSTNVLVTHPGFPNGSNFFGWFDISNINNITWNAGNLTGAITFTLAPVAVENFNGRAYWLTNPTATQPVAVFSDVLVPRTCTNATQLITFDDQVSLTALSPLPLNNQLGGIIQGIMIFKGSGQIYQVTGDAATNNLAKNALNIATGTDSAQSIAITAKGIAFASPEGMRVIDFNAQVTDPFGWDGQGKVAPFLQSVTPSRVWGAATGTVYRVTVQDGSISGSPYLDYWFDTIRGLWSGPHTCAMSTIDNYRATFIGALRGVNGKLFQSDVYQKPSSLFVENGTQLQWIWATSFLPDTDQMSENNIIEATIHMALEPNVAYPMQALDPSGLLLGSADVELSTSTTTPLWGTAVWGSFQWGQPPVALFPRPLNWMAPVVFRRIQFQINGRAHINIRIGALHCRYEQLGYLQQGVAA